MGERLRTVVQEVLSVRGDAGTVFTNRSGTAWSERNLLYALKWACGYAKIENCTLHTLRHTFASRLVKAGVGLWTVQELMGHKDISMTLRYIHLLPDHKRAAVFRGKIPRIFTTPLCYRYQCQRKNCESSLG